MPAVACKVSPAPAPPKAKGWSGCTGTATGDVPAKVNDLDALTPSGFGCASAALARSTPNWRTATSSPQ